MTKNNTKILSLVLIIATIIGGASYRFIDFKTTQTKTVAHSNDVWLGEPFSYFRDLKTVFAKKYLISTSSEMASQVGKEILAKGGNAIDAAIAAQMVLNVVEPQSSGIGGGAFVLYYDAKTKTTKYFNGRETAPAAANNKIFLDNEGKPKAFNDVVKGGLSVGTPGLLRVLKEVHSKYGKLSWEELFEPAIMIAKNGFPMDERIQVIAKNVAHLKDANSFAALYLKEDGTPKDLGSIVTNPALAETFSTIAKNGIDSFYSGKIANDIVEAVKNSPTNPGYLALEDLKNYQIKEGELICGSYRVKYKVCSMPLPSSGGVALLQILGILENFDLSKLKPSSAEAIHLITEATRLGYADRNKYVADVSDVPIDKMLDKEYLKQRSALINLKKSMSKVEAGEFADVKTSYKIDKKAVELPSTTHLSVVDSEGNAVAMTSSIEYYFGSVLNVDGFVLNNQLTDFSFVPEIDGKPVANSLEPGKQPRSSMSPTFVFDENNNLIMVVGSPGGPRIIQFVLKAIIAYLDWGLDVQKAISLPNFVVLNDTIELEKRTDLEKLQSDLKKMNHKVKIVDLVSGIHAIAIKPNGLEGGADPKERGLQLGNNISKSSTKIRLGVNIDHVATLRNARGGIFPCPVAAAKIAKKAGADGITAHLREDRRHIRDEDIFRLKKEVNLPLNFEMAATDEMVEIALKVKPNAVCLVPEKRQELTTEGGLNIIKNQKKLAEIIKKLKAKKIKISLFIDANLSQILAAKNVGADIIEVHTGKFCHLKNAEQKIEFKKIVEAIKYAEELGLECHAGHGLDFKTAGKIAKISQIVELNIGHFLIGEAIFSGLDLAVKKMKKIINSAR